MYNLLGSIPPREAAKSLLDYGVTEETARALIANRYGVGQATTDPAIQPTGTKHDNDKPRVDLLDPLALEGLAAVLAFGARKYAAHNWRGGISYCRLIAALLRHTFALIRGEDIDAESGLPHVDHLGCCWMFLSNMMKTRKDLDDRYKDKNSAKA